MKVVGLWRQRNSMIQYKPFSIFLLNKGRKPSTIKRYVYDIEDFGHWLEKTKSSLPVIYGLHFVQKDYEDYFSDLKKESTLLRENDAPCIHCIKSNASLSKYSQPIKEHGNFYSTRPHTPQ